MGCSPSKSIPENSSHSTSDDNKQTSKISTTRTSIPFSISGNAPSPGQYNHRGSVNPSLAINSAQQLIITSTDLEYRGNINWTEIKTNTQVSSNNAAIGSGGFGVVVKALWKYESKSNNCIEVAIKVITRSQVASLTDYQKLLNKFNDIIAINKKAEEKIIFKDCLIKTFGLCQGAIPTELLSIFHLKGKDEGIGMVMRLEKGGSLKNLIHPDTNMDRKSKLNKPLTITNKINIIFQLARAIAELHSVGIVHGDIKPENVLFSSLTPPVIVRLADFGYAKVKDVNMGASSIEHTKNHYGTMYYNAPEMFTNPISFDQDSVDSTALVKPSRKTDLYSFAILIWEVLTEEQAFKDILSEPALSIHLHRGKREDMSKCPKDTPREVMDIIQSCWNGDRKKRKSAIDCTVLLQSVTLRLSRPPLIDVIIDTDSVATAMKLTVSVVKPLLHLVCHHFIRCGLNAVCVDSSTTTTTAAAATAASTAASAADTSMSSTVSGVVEDDEWRALLQKHVVRITGYRSNHNNSDSNSASDNASSSSDSSSSCVYAHFATSPPAAALASACVDPSDTEAQSQSLDVSFLYAIIRDHESFIPATTTTTSGSSSSTTSSTNTIKEREAESAAAAAAAVGEETAADMKDFENIYLGSSEYLDAMTRMCQPIIERCRAISNSGSGSGNSQSNGDSGPSQQQSNYVI